eukprot:984492-Prorocentrum_minimum.AAC.1
MEPDLPREETQRRPETSSKAPACKYSALKPGLDSAAYAVCQGYREERRASREGCGEGESAEIRYLERAARSHDVAEAARGAPPFEALLPSRCSSPRGAPPLEALKKAQLEAEGGAPSRPAQAMPGFKKCKECSTKHDPKKGCPL